MIEGQEYDDADDDMHLQCFVCKEYKGTLCKSCGFIRYCGVECRQKDKEQHLIVCGFKRIFYLHGAYFVTDRLVTAMESEEETLIENLYALKKSPETLCGVLISLAKCYNHKRSDVAAFAAFMVDCIDPEGILQKRINDTLQKVAKGIDN